MWLRILTQSSVAAKALYTTVFFGALTWQLIRYQYRRNKGGQ